MRATNFLFFIAFSVVLLLVLYIQKQSAKDEYIKQKQEILLFEKEAKELAMLKKKYKDKKIAKRFVLNLQKIKAPSKDFTKSDSRVLEFDSLDARELNQLIKKIQNQTLQIKKIDIIRESESRSKLRLEIKNEKSFDVFSSVLFSIDNFYAKSKFLLYGCKYS